MYQKIVIDHFGPVEHAEVELRPLVILIGQQAGGKSTVAKLIYFFQTIPVEFFSRFYGSDREKVEMMKDLILPIREKFYEFFGSTFHLPDFRIVFHYNQDRTLSLSLNKEKKLFAYFSEGFFSENDWNELRGFKKEIVQVRAELAETDNPARRVLLDDRQVKLMHQMSDKINSLFSTKNDDQLYILAGRNATVGYSETFEDLVKQNIRKSIEEQGSRKFQSKEQTIDESLMLGFMQRVMRMRQLFVNKGNFEGMISMAGNGKKAKLITANHLVQQVIRGQYANSDFGERIVHNGNGYVYLKNASSGQQEAIRILQDAFVAIYQGNSVLRIVEEPEAHLFPEAQMYTIQLLALMLNSLPGSHLILTTHSPYTLTVINNLIYAAKVGNRHLEATKQIVEKDLWMPAERVAAYILHDGNAENIIDEDLQEIKAEMIDDVSQEINRQYETLMHLDDYGQD